MIPMLQAALLVRAADDPAAETKPVLVARPRGVVHVAVAPVTPSGRFIPRTARTVCRTHTRRLGVVPRARAVDVFRCRRVCVRCIKALLERAPGVDGRPLPRDVEAQLYSFLTIPNLRAVLRSCTTSDETHLVGRLALMLFGPKPMTPPARRSQGQAAVADLHDEIHRVRARLVAAERTPEEREAARQRRETETHNDALSARQRRRAIAIETAQEHQRAGRYLTPHERELLNTA
jgi:hypothetical protein